MAATASVAGVDAAAVDAAAVRLDDTEDFEELIESDSAVAVNIHDAEEALNRRLRDASLGWERRIERLAALAKLIM